MLDGGQGYLMEGNITNLDLPTFKASLQKIILSLWKDALSETLKSKRDGNSETVF